MTIQTSRILAILQNNLHKSKTRTQGILNNASSEKFDILLLQEQYWSEYNNSSLSHQSWTLIQPAIIGDIPPRSVIYINNKRLSTQAFTEKLTTIPDTTAIEIMNPHNKPTFIMNIYNPHQSNLTSLRTYLRHQLRPDKYHIIIIAGDFNLHHPLWNPSEYPIHDPKADELVDIMASHGLKLLLPAGTITYPRSKTTIDLVWGNIAAERDLLKCQIAEANSHGSDHEPIETIINSGPPVLIPRTPPFNYEKADWKALQNKLEEYLPVPIDPNPEHITKGDIDNYASRFTEAIRKAMNETIPRKRPTSFSKRWWNKKLDRLAKEANKARNRYRRTYRIMDEREWKEKDKELQRSIKKAQAETWRKLLTTADEKTIWKIKDYMDSTPTQPYISTLNGDATSNEEKALEFTRVFFPQPPPADTSDINETTEYPRPVPCNLTITMRQLETAINKASPDKAPGPDEIPNRVLKKAFSTIKHHLLALVQASVNKHHYPTPFKETTTIVIRKPGKPDYTKPNAYRPIALENTLGKILESIMTELINYLAETFHMLPTHHFGGRAGRTAEDAMMTLSEKIHETWKKHEVYSVVFMDVTGAFNNVHHERLIHNMRMRRIPVEITEWIYSFLKGRTTQLSFNGIKSATIPTPAGIPQGSPLSPTLYIIYNGDLVEPTTADPRDLKLGFIDDIAYAVGGPSAESNAERLREMLEKANVWKRKHGAQFEISKYALIHFTKNKDQDTSATVDIEGITLQPSKEARYLGVIFDQELNFGSHLQYIIKKGTKFALAMTGIAKAASGPPFKYVRQLFTSVVAPRTDYAAAVWYKPNKKTQLSRLTTVQRTAIKAITGCLRTTSTAAMQFETQLLPVHLRLKRQILRFGPLRLRRPE